MINDFNEIKDEKDREIYVQCRQILDNWFLGSQREHENHKDHKLNKCFNDDLNEFKKNLKEKLKSEVFRLPNMPVIIFIKSWILTNELDLIDKFMALISLNEYHDNLESKH